MYILKGGIHYTTFAHIFAPIFSLEESMLFAESHILQFLGNQAHTQYFGLQSEDINHIRNFDLILEQRPFLLVMCLLSTFTLHLII